MTEFGDWEVDENIFAITSNKGDVQYSLPMRRTNVAGSAVAANVTAPVEQTEMPALLTTRLHMQRVWQRKQCLSPLLRQLPLFLWFLMFPLFMLSLQSFEFFFLRFLLLLPFL